MYRFLFNCLLLFCCCWFFFFFCYFGVFFFFLGGGFGGGGGGQRKSITNLHSPRTGVNKSWGTEFHINLIFCQKEQIYYTFRSFKTRMLF